MNRVSGLLRVGLVISGFLAESGSSSVSAAIITNVSMVATQQFDSPGLGISNAILVATGPATFTFNNLDANNNTTDLTSTVDTLFTGLLPGEFAGLGLAGFRFDLFSIDGEETVTATNNGTHVRVDANFGLKVYDPLNNVLANFYTSIQSVFESDVNSLSDFSGAVFQDPLRPNDPTVVYLGASVFPFPPGTPFGISSNRTVAVAVPEPSSGMLLALAGIGCCLYHRKQRNPASRARD